MHVYDIYLRQKKEKGLVFFDGLVDGGVRFLARKYQEGISTAHNQQKVQPVAINGYFSSTIGSSSYSSVVDIVLGSFRYCVNSNLDTEVINTMKGYLKKMLYGQTYQGKKFYRDMGLIVRPHQKLCFGKNDIELLKKLGL